MQPEHAIIEAINSSPLNRGLDGAAWLADFRNVPFVQGSDIVLFDYEDADTYQGHFLCTSRGRAAVDVVRASFDHMFSIIGADLLFGMIPNDRRDAKLVARLAGARPAGTKNTTHGLCQLFVLSRELWKGEEE